MKSLSLTQPYATLVSLGAKKIETRSWATSYRGPLAIHAAKGLGPLGGWRGLRDLAFGRSEFRASLIAGLFPGQFPMPDELMAALPRGAIVAVARLVCCKVMNDRSLAHGWHGVEGHDWPLTDQEHAFGDYAPGRFAWLLTDIRALAAPIPCRGALGLWSVPADVERQIEAQL